MRIMHILFHTKKDLSASTQKDHIPRHWMPLPNSKEALDPVLCLVLQTPFYPTKVVFEDL